MDCLSQLPVDLFIQIIPYLPFDSVTNICRTNTKLHNYCTNPKYNNKWRKLIDNTFGNIYNYDDYLKQIRLKLGIDEGVYNYLVYTHLVKLLDPITQLMIYYRQGDIIFNSPHYTKVQKFMAMFLSSKKDKMMEYLPTDDYLPFINMLRGDEITQNILNGMLIEIASEGSIKGVSLMLSKGANIHAENEHYKFCNINTWR